MRILVAAALSIYFFSGVYFTQSALGAESISGISPDVNIALLEQKAEEDRLAELQRQSKAINELLKNQPVLQAGVVPKKEDWPLPKLIEDEAWFNPEIMLFYQKKYDVNDIKALYRLFLHEALEGNPRAMLILSYAYEHWGVGISSSFSVLYPPMHSAAYWKDKAVQLTSQEWVALRLGDLSLESEERRAFYLEAAALGSAEGLYLQGKLENKQDALMAAALNGHIPAASHVAYKLSFGLEGFPLNPRLASRYWWQAALGGEAWAQLICSEYFAVGSNGFSKDARRAYVFALFSRDSLVGSNTHNSFSKALTPEILERHINNLARENGFNSRLRWELQQEMEVLRAAMLEEKFRRLELVRLERQLAVEKMQKELIEVRGVLQHLPVNATEQQILRRLEQSSAGDEQEQIREYRINHEQSRRHDNRIFMYSLGIGIVTLFCVFIVIRLDILGRFLRFGSAGSKEHK